MFSSVFSGSGFGFGSGQYLVHYLSPCLTRGRIHHVIHKFNIYVTLAMAKHTAAPFSIKYVVEICDITDI